MLTPDMKRIIHEQRLGFVATAFALKSLGALALFKPGDMILWLTPGAMLGLPAGLMLYALLSRLPRRAVDRAEHAPRLLRVGHRRAVSNGAGVAGSPGPLPSRPAR